MFGFGKKKKTRKAFLETAASFLHSGWPAPETFTLACAAAFREADGHPRWSHLWSEVAAQLAAGGSLGEIMAEVPEVFSAEEAAAVAAAEPEGKVMPAVGRIAGDVPNLGPDLPAELQAESVRMRAWSESRAMGAPVSQLLADNIVDDFVASGLDGLVLLHGNVSPSSSGERHAWIASSAPSLPAPFADALLREADLRDASPNPGHFSAVEVVEGGGDQPVGTTVVVGTGNGGYAMRMKLPGHEGLARRVVRRVAWRTNTDYWIQHETGPIPLDRGTAVAADWSRRGDVVWLALSRPHDGSA
jgi:hypothetical protein